MQNAKRSMGAMALLVVVACTSTEDQASVAPSGSMSPSVSVLAASDCLEFACEGLLLPGEYRTSFDPTIDFEVTTPGWTWEYFGTARSGNFRLVADESHELPYNSDGIYFLLDPAVASADCEEAPEPGVGRSVEDLVAWVQSAPGLAVTEAKPVNIGGLDGVQLDLRLDPEWMKTCPFSDGMPVVPLVIRRADPGGYHWTIFRDMSMRWYILDWDDGALIVEIQDGPTGISHHDLLRSGVEIVHSMEFSPPS
jgi:hypothetical protein